MLRSQPGIYSIKVALLAERGVVEYDPNVWDADKIVGVSPPFSPFLLRFGIPFLPPPPPALPSSRCSLTMCIALRRIEWR